MQKDAEALSREDMDKSWRMLSPVRGSGIEQMSLDQALLEAASAPGFVPTLRFHIWKPPALSIGRFQDISEVDLDACVREGIDVARRPTGGKGILHLDDFTYGVVLPPSFPLPGGIVESYATLCGGILAALRRLGIEASIKRKAGDRYAHAKGACFAAVTEADLECGGRKICGSAQVRHRGAVLQHGSILMRDHSKLLFKLLRFESPEQRRKALASYRERCVSLDELECPHGWEAIAAAFKDGFEECFGVVLKPGELAEWEEERWRSLLPHYGSQRWLFNADREYWAG